MAEIVKGCPMVEPQKRAVQRNRMIARIDQNA